MAGHDLLPGCKAPWQHDCPGYLPSPNDPPRTGGMVCHCPCHGLRQTLEAQGKALEEAGGRFPADSSPSQYIDGWRDALHYVQHGELPDWE